MWQGIDAVVAGYAVMAVVVMATMFVWMSATVPGGVAAMRARMKAGPPDDMPMPGGAYLALNFVTSLGAAIAGAWVTSSVAGAPPRSALLGLAALVLLMGAVSARSLANGRQPLWYKLVIPLVGLLGVAVVALLRGA